MILLLNRTPSTVTVYDQQLEALEKAIRDLIKNDAVLKPQVERLIVIKGLALLSIAVLIAETNQFDRVDFYGLCKGKGIKFVIFFSSLHYRINPMNQLVANRIDD